MKHIFEIRDFSNPLNERIQAEYGQPGVPLYSHINIPSTNQRIEGPAKTEAAVRKLLTRIEAEQDRVRKLYKNSQQEASNEAGNVLFNYADELKGLGWIII